MRIPRRGVIAQRKGGGYVWAVYSLTYGIDESAGGTSGSVSLSSSRYKHAAKSYTVSTDGTVSLVDSVQTTAANMAVGDYLVNISTSNNTSTTGTTLYKITAISGSSTRKITYTAYTPALIAKGEDTGTRVKSHNDKEYPIDGIANGYYYILIEADGNPVVWAVYNVTYGLINGGTKSWTPSDSNWQISGTSYQIDAENGTIIILNQKQTVAKAISVGSYVSATREKLSSGKYSISIKADSDPTNAVAEVLSNTDVDTSDNRRDLELEVYYLSMTEKGEYTGTYVSGNTGDYPDSGVQGDYYYERLTP